jgi:Sulfotransferase domain
MKLIGAGLPRTATTTQKLALEMLGLGPCYHMRDLMENFEDHLPLWEEARDGRADWERIFDGYQSEVDWPGSFFWRELIDVYPDAKVLLSVRDAEGWERSMRDTIWSIYFGDSVMHHMARARYQVDPLWRRWYDLMVSMCWTGRGAFAGSYAERQQLMDAMERWNDEVRSTVPAGRLLEWHPRDGWEPLCEFLDVGVPDEPVPNVNDTEAFKQMIVGGAVQSVQQWWDREQAAVA